MRASVHPPPTPICLPSPRRCKASGKKTGQHAKRQQRARRWGGDHNGGKVGDATRHISTLGQPQHDYGWRAKSRRGKPIGKNRQACSELSLQAASSSFGTINSPAFDKGSHCTAVDQLIPVSRYRGAVQRRSPAIMKRSRAGRRIP